MCVVKLIYGNSYKKRPIYDQNIIPFAVFLSLLNDECMMWLRLEENFSDCTKWIGKMWTIHALFINYIGLV